MKTRPTSQVTSAARAGELASSRIDFSGSSHVRFSSNSRPVVCCAGSRFMPVIDDDEPLFDFSYGSTVPVRGLEMGLEVTVCLPSFVYICCSSQIGQARMKFPPQRHFDLAGNCLLPKMFEATVQATRVCTATFPEAP